MNSSIDVRGVISRVFQIYVDQSSVLMPAAAVVFFITGVVSSILISASSGLELLSFVVDLVGTSLFTGMVVELVADVQDGRRDATPGQLLRAITPVLGQLITVGFLAALAEGIGLILFIIPGLLLLTIWSVFAPVIVLERPTGLHALRRSRELVRGNALRVFTVILVLVILVGILTTAVSLAGEAGGTAVGLIVRVVAGILTAPFPALAAAVLYFDLRNATGP